jgi:hypothetical protein
MEYECKRCGYVAKTLGNLKKHYNNKKTCKAIKADISLNALLYDLDSKKTYNYTCDICNKGYSTRQSLHVHKKNHVKPQETTKEPIKKEVTPPSIQLRYFNSENVKHIESDKDYLLQCLVTKDIVGIIKNIHFDKEHPENFNIRLRSTKKNLMEIFDNNEWIINDLDDALDELINKVYRILVFFSYRNKELIISDSSEEEYYEMREWLETVYNNNVLRKPLKRKLLILFMNNNDKSKNKVLKPKDESSEDESETKNVILKTKKNSEDESETKNVILKTKKNSKSSESKNVILKESKVEEKLKSKNVILKESNVEEKSKSSKNNILKENINLTNLLDKEESAEEYDSDDTELSSIEEMDPEEAKKYTIVRYPGVLYSSRFNKKS